MAPQVTCFNDITPDRFNWKVVARVIQLWKVPSKIDQTIINGIDMILVDGQGGKIHASIKKTQMNNFYNIVKEGNTYVSQNILVVPNDGKYRATRNVHKIIFIKTTRVTNYKVENIPGVNYDFTNFRDIINDGDDTWLSDVIGHVIERDEVKDINKSGHSHQILEITLQDLSENQIKCTLWDQYADQMSLHISNQNSADPIIIILEMCLVKSFNGQNSISNAFHNSRLLINENSEEHRAYREKLIRQDGTFTQSISVSSNHRSTGIADDLLLTKQMTINNLRDCTTERAVVVLAKVIDIDPDTKWWYDACPKCFRKVEQTSTQFCCPKCPKDIDPIPRYRLQVLVFDTIGSTKFVMFDKFVCKIVGKSATELIGDVHKDNLTDTIPKEFDAIINKEFMFKVEISAMNISKSWSVYTVKTMTGDHELIRQFRVMHSIEDEHSSDNNAQQQGDNLDDFVEPDDETTPISKLRGKELGNNNLNDFTDSHDKATPIIKLRGKGLGVEAASSNLSNDETTKMSTTKSYKRIKTEKP